MRAMTPSTASPSRVAAHLADLLRLAVRLASADRRLLGRHRHEQRVLALDALVRGAHREVAGAERVAARHVDRRDRRPGRAARPAAPAAAAAPPRSPRDRSRRSRSAPATRSRPCVASSSRLRRASTERAPYRTCAMSPSCVPPGTAVSRRYSNGVTGRCQPPTDRGTVEDLRGKVAVVTGGASGIGLAMVQRFAPGGHDGGRGRRARPTRSTTRRRSCAPTASTRPRRVVDVTDYDSVAELADARPRRARRGPRAVQQRGRRLGRRRLHLGARARRLAVGLRRQRVGRDPRHQGVRAATWSRSGDRATS